MLIFSGANASSAVVLKTFKCISPQTFQALYAAAVASTLVAIERIDYYLDPYVLQLDHYLRGLYNAGKQADVSVPVPSPVGDNAFVVPVSSGVGSQKVMDGVGRNTMITTGAVIAVAALAYYSYCKLYPTKQKQSV